jgi:hypothetical protein
MGHQRSICAAVLQLCTEPYVPNTVHVAFVVHAMRTPMVTLFPINSGRLEAV